MYERYSRWIWMSLLKSLLKTDKQDHGKSSDLFVYVKATSFSKRVWRIKVYLMKLTELDNYCFLVVLDYLMYTDNLWIDRKRGKYYLRLSFCKRLQLLGSSFFIKYNLCIIYLVLISECVHFVFKNLYMQLVA